MKHDALIAPDESQFAFTPKIAGLAASDGSADTITVPDAELLFQGTFKRDGDDLKIIGKDGNAFLVDDYFKHDKKPALLSPEGASLSSAVIEALAGPQAPGQYAQAGAQPGTAQAIGKVEKADGNCTVVRNGVTITVNAGDVVMKGDVVQTGAGGSLAIIFTDGTAFNLAANARMVLNDFVYNAGGGGNSALISLVQGSISFVAGQVAKTGDMKVETPVATMGIRGTAVLVEIDANNGQTKFSVMVEPNGTTGSFNLYNKTTGALIATVNNSTIGWVVTPAGPLQVIAQQVQKTPAELARELAIVQQVFQTFNMGPFDPNAPQQQQQQDPQRRGDNPQGTNTAGGSGTPPTTDTIKVTVTQVGGTTSGTPGTPSNAGGPTGTGPTGPGTDGTTQTPGSQIIETPTLNPISGSGIINGTAGADYITGSNLVDTIDAGAGNDFVFAFGGNDIIIAGHGEGNDFYDGGAGDNDVIRFPSALADQPLTFHLNNFSQESTAQGAIIGLDTFKNIERIESGAGGDTFHLHAGAWHINAGDGDDTFILYDAFHSDLDGGDGIDTIFFVGDLSITGNTDGPDVASIEIIDLNTTHSNTVDLDIEGVLELLEGSETGYLKIEGTSADQVNFTNEDIEDFPNGTWRLAVTSDELDEIEGYTPYVFDNEGEIEAVVYVQDGIVVDGVDAGATVEDRFNSQAYDLNDGSDDWATNWTETNDDFSGAPNGSPTAGEIFISHDPTTSPGNLQLTLTDNDAEGDSGDTIQRSADLTGATSATLTFDYRRVDMENDDSIQIYASNGGNFVLIGEIEGNGLDDEGYQTFTFDLTSFISANTTVQFAVDDRLENGDTVYIDNVEIAYVAPPDNKPDVTFTNYDVDGASATYVLGINDNLMFNGFGEIVGQYINEITFGFYSDGDAPETFSFGSSTSLENINDSGVMVGRSLQDGLILYQGEPTLVTFNGRTTLDGINNSGIAVGNVLSGGNFFAIMGDGFGGFTMFIKPGATDTRTGDINDSGDIVGFYDEQHGYIYRPNGEITEDDFTVLDHPLGALGTFAVGINNADEVVGWYVDAGGNTHGFLKSGDTYYTIDHPDAAEGTFIADINNSNQIVGWYVDAEGVTRGFLATIGLDDYADNAPVIHTDNFGTTGESGSTTLFDVLVSDAGNGGGDMYDVTVTSRFGKLSMANAEANAADTDPLDTRMEFLDVTLAEINEGLHAGITYTDPTAPIASPVEKVTLTVEDPDGHTDTVNFIFNVFGDENVALDGTDEKDVIFGTGYADIFSGGAKSDAFVFAVDELSSDYTDTITDFDVNEDRIVLEGGPYDSVDDLTISYFLGGDAMIEFDNGGRIVLEQIPGQSLTASNFVFHPFNTA